LLRSDLVIVLVVLGRNRDNNDALQHADLWRSQTYALGRKKGVKHIRHQLTYSGRKARDLLGLLPKKRVLGCEDRSGGHLLRTPGLLSSLLYNSAVVQRVKILSTSGQRSPGEQHGAFDTCLCAV